MSNALEYIDEGDYGLAAIQLRSIIDSLPGSDIAADALYNLAKISISEKNVAPDFTSALDNFITFVSLYPDDPRVESAKEQIFLITLYLNKKEDLDAILKLVTQFQRTYEQYRVLQLSDLENLGKDIAKCYDDRNALSQKVEELKQVIIELERKCLKAGR